MPEIILLLTGSVLLLLIIYDFFFTTLSQSGAGFLTLLVLRGAHFLLQTGVRVTSRKFYRFSGMITNLVVLAVWVIGVWLGLFLIFSSDPQSIVNEQGRAANVSERLYFTGYTLSTLGIGDFMPVSRAFRILVSCFSFFGFIFFTTSMTYLVSVSSGIIHKRTLAQLVQNFGTSPEEMVNHIRNRDRNHVIQKSLNIQEIIGEIAVNLQAFPVIAYYSTSRSLDSFGLNLARLDEAMTLIFYTETPGINRKDFIPLRKSLDGFLKFVHQDFPDISESGNDGALSFDFPPGQVPNAESEEDIRWRRKILSGMLHHEGLDWNDVFQKSSGSKGFS